MTELLYKSSQLLTFVNDRVFEQLLAAKNNSALYDCVEKILGFVETSECVFELAGSLAGGEVGKWAIIFNLQCLK